MKIGLIDVDGRHGKKNGELRYTLTWLSARLPVGTRCGEMKWNGHSLPTFSTGIITIYCMPARFSTFRPTSTFGSSPTTDWRRVERATTSISVYPTR